MKNKNNKNITELLREAKAGSWDESDSAGVCPLCYKEDDPKMQVAIRQHDLDYLMHDAGLSDKTRKESDDNLRFNLLFAAKNNKRKIIKALALSSLAYAFGWIFW